MIGNAKLLNPSSIHVRFGHAYQIYQDAAARHDLDGAAVGEALMADAISVFLTETEWQEYEAMPGFAYGDDRNRSQVFQDVRARARWSLRHANEHGVYGRPQEEYGDASSLDDEEPVEA